MSDNAKYYKSPTDTPELDPISNGASAGVVESFVCIAGTMPNLTNGRKIGIGIICQNGLTFTLVGVGGENMHTLGLTVFTIQYTMDICEVELMQLSR